MEKWLAITYQCAHLRGHGVQQLDDGVIPSPLALRHGLDKIPLPDHFEELAQSLDSVEVASTGHITISTL